MRKNVFGRQFGRDEGERKALFKGLASSLVLHERIQTTEEKAKSIKGHVEKLVTKAKTGDLHATRSIQPFLTAEATSKMVAEIAPRFKNRPGGYTRIIRMGKRLQDNATMVILEWVEKRPEPAATTKNAPKTAKSGSATGQTKEATVKIASPNKTTKKTTKKAAKTTKKKESNT